MSLILDCSATLALLLDDEHTDYSRLVLKLLANHGADVPSLWSFEVGNSLTMAIRRKRINETLRQQAFQVLNGFDIHIDQDCNSQAWQTTIVLADQYRLSVYDAAYLELALRRVLPLATRDEALADAARQAGATVL